MNTTSTIDFLFLRTAMTLGSRLAMTLLLTLMTGATWAYDEYEIDPQTWSKNQKISTDVTFLERITINGEVMITIEEGITMTASKGIEVPEGNTLTIGGNGTLIAEGKEYDNAGIGGGGTIIINGGTVTATGGGTAAGIGGRSGCDGGTIIINGGTVTATGGSFSAGIGGGGGSNAAGGGGIIIINGGTIIATGSDLAAGIGGGGISDTGTGGDGGTITIKGGTVTATGGYLAAGIGGGCGGVYNFGDAGGACGDITISGGKVTANRGEYGIAGIGSGNNGPKTGSVTLGWRNEDDFIYATNYYNIKTLTFAEGKQFYFIDNGEYIDATPDNIGGKTIYPLVSRKRLSSANISGLKSRYLYTGDNIEITYTVTDIDGNELVKGTHYTETISPSPVNGLDDYTLTITAINGGGYTGKKEISFSVVKFDMGDAVVTGLKSYYLYTGDEISVAYSVDGLEGYPMIKGTDYTETFTPSTIKEKGEYELTLTAASVGYTGSKTIHFSVGDAIPVTSGTTVMNAINRVTNEVTIDTRIQINGDVTLILDEGSTLNATKGIELSSGNKLTIMGKGTLNATGGDEQSGIGAVEVGTLVIEDGIINATGGTFAAGIGGSYANRSGGTITINGGTVNARGGHEGPGIGGGSAQYGESNGICGTITINGGKVTAYGDIVGIGATEYAPISGTITLGWTNEDDFIYSKSYERVSSLSFVEGKSFGWTDNGETIVVTIDNIGGKKIIPLNTGSVNDLSHLTVNGIESYYLYTGNEIVLDYVVKDADEKVLEKGTDFTESYSPSPVKDCGDYTLTLTAIDGSGYTGSREFSFTVGEGIPITSTTTELTERYYSVPNNVTISERISIHGDVRIFLNEGKTLTASKGIDLSNGNKLTIDGSGTLVASGDDNFSGIGSTNVGTLVINQGIVNATGGNGAAGIGSNGSNTIGGTIIINGGKVTATGGISAAGIGGGFYGVCGTVSINGGKVIANGGNNAPGIGPGVSASESGTVTLDCTNEDDYIYASSYGLVGSLSIANGKTLIDDDGNTYSGALTTEQKSTLAGKTLRPRAVVVSPPYTQDFSDGLSGWTIVDDVDGTGISSESNPYFRFKSSSSPQYLISPMLMIDAMIKLSLYAKIYVDNDEVAHPASFQIGFSPSTKNISDFTWGDVLTISDGTTHAIRFYLPAEAKYVAIKYVSGNWLFFDNISITNAVTNVTFAKEGFSTYYDSHHDLTLPAGVKAYIVTANERAGALTYLEIADGSTTNNIVPKGTAVMLRTAASDAKQTIDIPLASPTAAAISETNLLHGSDTEITTTGGDAGAKYYKLSYGTDQTGNGGDDLTSVLGWFWGAADGAAFTSAAHKAWLVLPPSTAGTRGFFGLPGDDETTLLRKVNSEEVNSEEWFSLDGRRLSGKPTAKGLYIHNGRKEVVR